MRQIPDAIFDAIESLNLPSIPHVLLRFVHLVEDDRSSISELAALVGQDPALGARFLTVANSPVFRSGTESKTLERCMIVLGTRLARTLATCLVIQRVFDGVSGNSNFNFTGFWWHSLRVAELARAIATRMNRCDIEEAYLAGLLHDAGQLLLLGGLKGRYEDILRLSLNEAVLYALEGPMLDTDHAKVAAWLIDQWNLTSFMSDAVLFHHATPEEIVDADPLSQIIWSSHAITSHNENIDPEKKLNLPDLFAVKSMLGMDLDELGKLHRSSHERVAMLAEALGIIETEEVRTLPAAYEPLERRRPVANIGDPAFAGLENVICDMALKQSLLATLSSYCSENELLVAVRESALILFGLGRPAFLLLQPENPVLSCPVFEGQPPLLQRLEIRIDSPQSLAAAVVAGDGPCSTFDKEPLGGALVDVQIARALDSEGLLYVPMRTRTACLGIMVYGLNPARHARIRRHLEWMSSFAQMAAVSLESWRELRNYEHKIESSLASRFEQQTRKVVHEARNPLGIIKNYLKIISQRLPEENVVRQELDILKEEIDRVSQILKRMNDLSVMAPVLDMVDVNVVIKGMLALYGESLFTGGGISVEMTLDSQLAPLPCDRDRLKQILLNLWKNAAEAMPQGGRFVISTHDNVILDGCSHVEIRLGDSGPGLPPDVMERLFQPLEPNRRPGHAGIGLSIVAMLVESLDGTIRCQSSAGQGTSFIIQLPRTGVVEK